MAGGECSSTHVAMRTPAWLDNGAGVLVKEGWESAQDYADQAFVSASDLIAELTAAGDEMLDIPDITIDVGFPNTSIASMILPDTPAPPEGFALNLPAIPNEPTIGDVESLSIPDAPLFTAQLPAIDLNIAKPGALSATIPMEPTLDAIAMPAEPSITLPDVPTLISLSIPNAPAINMPAFMAALADAPDDAPDTALTFTEPTYVSTLLDALKSKLLEWVNGASTGVSPAVEQAIWDRARAREDVASRRALDEVNRGFASRGFSIPPGAMLKAAMEAVQETVNKNSALSREVAIKQADMEQANRRFAFEQSWQLESGLLNYANQVAQRAFDVAKFTLQAALDIFTAKITRFNAQVQAYGVEAEVYKARIQAELAVLDVFKAELDGQRLVGEINLQQVEIYKARIQAVNATIEMYNGQVNAANTKAGINKTIIEGFATRVQAYDSIVKAKASEYDAYATQVKAEVSKADVFKSQADAYRSQVEGYSALVGARVAEIDANIKVNQEVPLEVYKHRIAAFGELVTAEAARVGALADVYRTDGSVYQATAGALAAKAGADAEGYKAEASLLIGKANVLVESAKINIDKVMKGIELMMEAIKAGAQVQAQLAASALSSVNLSGSLSQGQTQGQSVSASYGQSETASNSTSCTTTYSHSD